MFEKRQNLHKTTAHFSVKQHATEAPDIAAKHAIYSLEKRIIIVHEEIVLLLHMSLLITM